MTCRNGRIKGRISQNGVRKVERKVRRTRLRGALERIEGFLITTKKALSREKK